MTDLLALAERLDDSDVAFYESSIRMNTELNRLIGEAATALREAHEQLDKFRNGYQGSCYACEPVGILNQKLQAEVERLRVILQRACIFMKSIPTDEQLDAILPNGDNGRAIWASLEGEKRA